MNLIMKISILLLFICSASSQQKLSFRHYSVKEGLSQTTIQSIFQDKAGFLWIGTRDGLNRFDGYKFYHYNFSDKDTNSISNGLIKTIFQDDYGNLWIGTKKGLNKFVIKNKSQNNFEVKFIHFFSDNGDKDGLSNDDIKAIYQTSNGDLWIGTSNGLNRITSKQLVKENKKLKFIKYYPANKKADDNNITSITEDNNGNLWIGTFGGALQKLNIKTGDFSSYTYHDNNLNSPGSNFIVSLYFSKNNMLWIGTNANGLIKLELENEKFTIYKQMLGNKSENRVSSIVEDIEGNLWLGSFGGGIVKFDTQKEIFTVFRNDNKYTETIGNDFVRTIFIDRSNNLWAGTNETLEKTNLGAWELFHYKNIPWNKNSLQDNHVLSIYEDHLSNLWLGSDKGLDKFEYRENKFIHYNIHSGTGKVGNLISVIYEDKDKYLWIGTLTGRIYKYDRTENNFSQFLYNPIDNEPVIESRITSITEDRWGNILIGSHSGIYKLNKITEEFSHCILSSKDSTILAEKKINVIYQNKASNYWIGTSKGLVRINRDSSCLEYYHINDDLHSISPGSINSICEDKSGNLWIGTDHGLNLLNKKNKQFKKFTIHDGIPDNEIKAILEDSDGNIWFSSQKGITKLIYKPNIRIKFRNYDITDGLQNFDFNMNSAFKNKDGILFFGGFNGFNFFNPSSINENENLPPVVITSFKKFDKEIFSVDELSEVKEIKLEHSDKFFSFEFAALDFTQPSKHKYAYKMEGFDDKWIFTGNNRIAAYTNLDPGEYVFRVKASNNDGNWNEKGTFIKLIIKPPIWQTWWAYTLYIFVVIISLFYVRKYELDKRKRKEQTVLKEEREKAELSQAHLRAEKAEFQAKAIESEKEIEKQNIRYRIASDLHDEIGSNLSSITLLSSILSKKFKDNTEVMNKLNDINTAARLSSESIRDIVWFINPMSDQLGKLISRMKETANMMLGNIDYCINDSTSSKNLKINPDIKRNIYLIYKEILNNINKHSKANKVDIIIRKDNNCFNLTVKDNGNGFYRKETTTGNGLENLKIRAEQIHGKLTIDTQLGRGTCIQLKLWL